MADVVHGRIATGQNKGRLIGRGKLHPFRENGVKDRSTAGITLAPDSEVAREAIS